MTEDHAKGKKSLNEVENDLAEEELYVSQGVSNAGTHSDLTVACWVNMNSSWCVQLMELKAWIFRQHQSLLKMDKM